jgi:hypothetical protein
MARIRHDSGRYDHLPARGCAGTSRADSTSSSGSANETRTETSWHTNARTMITVRAFALL